MANSALIQSFRSEYSENILPITALVTEDTTINSFDDGFVEVSNDYQFSDNKSIKLEMTLNSTGARSNIFNLGSDLTTTVKYDGRYIFSFRFLDNSSGTTFPQVSMGFNVFINSVLTHTFENFYDLSENQDLKFYTLAQTFDLNANDVVDFSFFCSSGSIAPPPTLILYFSGFKLELDDRFLGIPSIYSKPIDTISDTGFQSRTDTTNEQTLTSLTDNLISFSGTLEENGGLTLMDSNAKITPMSLNDIISVDFAFTGVVPVGTNLFLSIYLKVNGNIFRATTLPIIKGAGLDDHFSVSWILPIGADFLANGAEIYVNPIVGLTIKNRYISVTRIGKGN
jgi:hypothetical protein